MMMMMAVMKTSVLTMLAALLRYENFPINGKMNFFFSLCLTILLMELVDCTILIGKDNDENSFVQLHDYL